MVISSASTNGSSNIAGGAPPPERSASRIVARAATGSHTLTIRFSQIKVGDTWLDRGRMKARSATFTVGGHTWYTELRQQTRFLADDSIFLFFLRLHCACAHCNGGGDGKQAEVTASYTVSFLDDDGDGGRRPSYSHNVSNGKASTFTENMSSGMKIAESVMAPHVRGDRLIVRCDVTVYMELCYGDSVVPSRLVAVPPPDIGDHLGRLLSTGAFPDLEVDIAGGDTFAAHRCILNARSPVLLEEILGSGCKKTVGVDARVFKALLHYIYTDSLLDIDDDGEAADMARHLIAAADRYSLDRLKLICEDMLCRRVDTSTVAATLALAEEYRCHGLKKACVQFLMSGSNLKAAMADDGFEHLRNSCPSVLRELLAMVDRR